MVFVELGGVLDRHVPAGKVDELGAEADVFCVQSGFLERHDNSRFEGYDAIPGATAAPDRATSGHPWPARGSFLPAMLAKRHDPPLCPWTCKFEIGVPPLPRRWSAPGRAAARRAVGWGHKVDGRDGLR